MVISGVGSISMRAWMRFSIFVVLFSLLFGNSASFADELSPELNATFSPGADGRSVTLSTSVRIPTYGNSNVAGTESAYSLSPLVWYRYYVPVPSTSSVNGCDPQTQSPPSSNTVLGSASDTGILVNGIYRNRTTGEIVYESYYCLEPGDSAVPGFVPQVPTYAQIWNALYSKAFQDGSTSSGAYIAPASPGLTGLPTNIWAQFPDGQSISRNEPLPGGFRIRATATITEVSIFSTSPKGSIKSLANLSPNNSGKIEGGSFDDPAVIEIFSTKGKYQISTGIIWTANNAILSGPNIEPISVPLGSIRIEINREYEVHQLLPGLTK